MTKKKQKAISAKEAGVHSTHGKEQLLFVRAIVNGVLCAAYIKNNMLVSYEPWEDVNRQMYIGPCLEFKVPKTEELDHPNAC